METDDVNIYIFIFSLLIIYVRPKSTEIKRYEKIDKHLCVDFIKF